MSEIKRIDSYDDNRFSEKVLYQHGGFLVNGVPCSIEITNKDTAVVYCNTEESLEEVIEQFRFYAEHICKFYDGSGKLIKEFPPQKIFEVSLNDIQPSQFYVDEDKLIAVNTFIKHSADIIIPLYRFGEKYISLDGHARLALAVQRGYKNVKGFIAQCDFQVLDFVKEAQKRGVYSPHDLKIITHSQYKILWDEFCDNFFDSNKK